MTEALTERHGGEDVLETIAEDEEMFPSVAVWYNGDGQSMKREVLAIEGSDRQGSRSKDRFQNL